MIQHPPQVITWLAAVASHFAQLGARHAAIPYVDISNPNSDQLAVSDLLGQVQQRVVNEV